MYQIMIVYTFLVFPDLQLQTFALQGLSLEMQFLYSGESAILCIYILLVNEGIFIIQCIPKAQGMQIYAGCIQTNREKYPN